MSASSLGIAVSTGTIRPDRDLEMAEDMSAGLKLGLVMDGHLGLEVADRPGIQLSGPAQCLLTSRRDFAAQHSLRRDGGLRYLTVSLDPATSDDLLGRDADRLHALASDGGAVGICHGRATRAVCALAHQICACPFQGGIRQLHQTAKALELVAAVAAGLLTPDCPEGVWRAGELDKLMEARHILARSPANAPSLPVLARQVGLNVRKLTDGFRQHFGTTVAEFLTEQRLQEGYRLLSTGAMGVAQAAYAIGYTPNHFSHAFGRRFGVPPGQVRRPA